MKKYLVLCDEEGVAYQLRKCTGRVSHDPAAEYSICVPTEPPGISRFQVVSGNKQLCTRIKGDILELLVPGFHHFPTSGEVFETFERPIYGTKVVDGSPTTVELTEEEVSELFS